MICFNCENELQAGDEYLVFSNPYTEKDVVICWDCIENADIQTVEEEPEWK